MGGRAYAPPTFPMVAGIYTGASFLPENLRLEAPVNLAYGKGVTVQGWFPLDGVDSLFGRALFPRGTDVRDRFASTGVDNVEIPAGSGRWYYVLSVYDAGAGFPNEHRVAIVAKTGGWPTPLPPIWVPPGEEGLIVETTKVGNVGVVLPPRSERTELDLFAGLE
jgi:hypothetical protein